MGGTSCAPQREYLQGSGAEENGVFGAVVLARNICLRCYLGNNLPPTVASLPHTALKLHPGLYGLQQHGLTCVILVYKDLKVTPWHQPWPSHCCPKLKHRGAHSITVLLSASLMLSFSRHCFMSSVVLLFASTLSRKAYYDPGSL